MENKQSINEGIALKNYFKGSGKSMGEIAEKLQMTRQNLNHHLRKPVLEGNFALLIESIFNIDLKKDVFSKLKITETETPVEKKAITGYSKDQLESILDKFSDGDMPYNAGVNDIKRIAIKYKSWFDRPPMSEDLLDLYYAIANEHSSVKLFANLMSRMDIVEQKIQ